MFVCIVFVAYPFLRISMNLYFASLIARIWFFLRRFMCESLLPFILCLKKKFSKIWQIENNTYKYYYNIIFPYHIFVASPDIYYRKKVITVHVVDPHRLASLIYLLFLVRFLLQRHCGDTSLIMMIIVLRCMSISLGFTLYIASLNGLWVWYSCIVS